MTHLFCLRESRGNKRIEIIFKENNLEILQQEKAYEKNNSWSSDTACCASCSNCIMCFNNLPQTARTYC